MDAREIMHRTDFLVRSLADKDGFRGCVKFELTLDGPCLTIEEDDGALGFIKGKALGDLVDFIQFLTLNGFLDRDGDGKFTLSAKDPEHTMFAGV